jgi:hypothetical protein
MQALGASRVAEISLFSSGLVITFFHLFLRTNATRMVIRPIEELKAPTKQQRPKLRFFGPSDLEMQISGPMALQTTQRLSDRQGLIDVGPEKNRGDFDAEYFERPERVLTPGSAKTGSSIDPTKWPLPPMKDEVIAPSGREPNTRGYSLFPTRAEEVPRLPATVYDPKATQGSQPSKLALRRFTRRSSITNVGEAFDFLTRPKLPFGERHQRMQSTDSSVGTLQIGLRFSVAPATLAAAKCTRAERTTPPLTRSATDASGESLGSFLLPSTAYTTPSEETPAPSPSAFPQPPSRDNSPTRYSPTRTPGLPPTPAINSSAYLAAQREKVLPPPPPRSPNPAPRSETLIQPAVPAPAIMSGLRMNPITPTTSVGSPTASQPGTPASLNLVRSNSDRTAPSPTARIPLGAGTMARTPPPNGWI